MKIIQANSTDFNERKLIYKDPLLSAAQLAYKTDNTLKRYLYPSKEESDHWKGLTAI